MKKKLSILIIFLLSFVFAQSQPKPASMVWYFGNKVKLDFNVPAGNPPTVSTGDNPQIFSHSGASWSGPYGELKFYTDGYTVWNKDGFEQITGMNGTSFQQPALIFPSNMQKDTFYIVTAPHPSMAGNEANYIKVSYNSTTNDISEIETVTINSNSAGKMAATRSFDMFGYWVLTHNLDSDEFMAVRIDESGATDFITSQGVENYGSFGTPAHLKGMFKFSPSGQYLAATSTLEGKVHIYNFDNETGQLTHHSEHDIAGAYGIEFSPNEKYLYVGQNGLLNCGIEQIDIEGGTKMAVAGMGVADRYVVALQLAPDGKIYFAHQETMGYNDFLGAINDPNEMGTMCNANKEQVLVGMESNYINLSLTSFPSNLVMPKAPLDFNKVAGGCAGSPTTFQIVDDTGIDSVHWYFNDPNNAPNDYSEDFSPSYEFWNGGTHNVELTAWYGSLPYTKTISIDINGPEIYGFNKPATVCTNSSILGSYSLGSPPVSGFYWENQTFLETSTNEEFVITNPGDNEIFFQVTDQGGCTSTYTETVYVAEAPYITDLPATAEGCDEVTISGNAFNYVQIDWEDEFGTQFYSGFETSQTFNVFGNYEVYIHAMNDNGCQENYTVTVTVHESPTVYMSDQTVCDSITLYRNNHVSATNPLTITNWQVDGTAFGTSNQLFLGVPGTYSIELFVEDVNGCSAQDGMNLTINEVPELDFTGVDFSDCSNISFFPTVVSDYETMAWATPHESGTSAPIDISFPGSYNLDINLLNLEGCPRDYTIPVEIFQSPEFSLGGDISICQNYTITATPINVPSPISSHQWYVDGAAAGSQPSFYFNEDTPGTYSITYEAIDGNNCVATEHMQVTVTGNPTLDLAPSYSGCDFVEVIPANISSNAAYTIYWMSESGLQQGTGDSFTFSDDDGNETFLVNVSINDDNGCYTHYQTTVSAYMPPSIMLENTGTGISSCDTLTLPLETSIISSSYPITSYSWLNITTNDTGDESTYFLDEVGSFEMQLEVTDENGCTASDVVDVNIIEGPTLTFSQPFEACDGITLSPTHTASEPSFYWENLTTGEQFYDPTFTISEIGAFQILAKITDIPTGCYNYYELDVEVFESPTSELGGNLMTCDTITLPSDLANIYGTTPLSYSWTNVTTSETGTNETFFVDNLGNNLIQLTVTDENNCSSVATEQVVTVNESPQIDFGEDMLLCVNETTTLSIPADTYESIVWSTGELDVENITVWQTGNYWVEATNSQLCTGTDTIYIEKLGCQEFDLEAKINTEFSVDEEFSICSGSRNVTLTALPDFINSGTCYDQTNANSNFYWLTGDGQSLEGSEINYNFADYGTYQITLVVEDVEGCKESKQFDLNISRTPFPPENIDKEACFGDSLQIVAGREGDVDLLVNMPRITFPTIAIKQETQSFDSDNQFVSSSYIVHNTNSDVNVENAEDIIGVYVNMEHSSITQIEKIEISCETGQTADLINFTTIAPDQQIIMGEPVIGDEASPQAGNGYSYFWSEFSEKNMFEIIDNQVYPVINYTDPNGYELGEVGYIPSSAFAPQMSFDNLAGCPIEGEWTLKINDEYIDENGFVFEWAIQFSSGLVFAEIGMPQANWTGANILGVTNDSLITVMAETEGSSTYTLSLTDQFGCSYVKDIELLTEKIALDLGNDTTLCTGDQFEINAENEANVTAVSYNWSTGETTSTILIEEAGDYQVEITGEACARKDTIKIEFVKAPQLDLIDEITLINGETTTLDAGEIADATYFWQPTEETTSQIEVSEEGTYTVFVTKGCTTSDSVVVKVSDIQLIIPSAFTPNGDGANDTWQFGNAEHIGEIEVSIFDKNGSIMTYYILSQDTPEGWDGTQNGNPVISDTYWYVLRFEDGTSQSGTVTLKR